MVVVPSAVLRVYAVGPISSQRVDDLEVGCSRRFSCTVAEAISSDEAASTTIEETTLGVEDRVDALDPHAFGSIPKLSLRHATRGVCLTRGCEGDRPGADEDGADEDSVDATKHGWSDHVRVAETQAG